MKKRAELKEAFIDIFHLHNSYYTEISKNQKQDYVNISDDFPTVPETKRLVEHAFVEFHNFF